MLLFPLVMFVTAFRAVTVDVKNIMNLLMFLAAAWAVLGVLPLIFLYVRARSGDLAMPKRILLAIGSSIAAFVVSEVLLVVSALLGAMLNS